MIYKFRIPRKLAIVRLNIRGATAKQHLDRMNNVDSEQKDLGEACPHHWSAKRVGRAEALLHDERVFRLT